MSPLAAARARLACAPSSTREPVVTALFRLGWASGRAVRESLKSTLRYDRSQIDPAAALQGGARESDEGGLVHVQ